MMQDDWDWVLYSINDAGVIVTGCFTQKMIQG